MSYFGSIASPEQLVESLAMIADADKPSAKVFNDMAYALNVHHEDQIETLLSALPENVDQMKLRSGLLGATHYYGDEPEQEPEADADADGKKVEVIEKLSY